MDYLPKTDSQLREFAVNFAGRVLAAPASYGLVAGDAAQIDSAVQEFVSKYELAINPVSRTKAAIIAKDNAKGAMVAFLRGYARGIKSNSSVADEDKANLGLRVKDASRTRVPAPQTHPIIMVVGLGVRQHELKIVDELTPDSRCKPAGVAGVQLFCRLGDAPPSASPLSSDFMELLTRGSRVIHFKQEDVGKRAYYFGRWQTAAGRVGPWGLVASRMIAE